MGAIRGVGFGRERRIFSACAATEGKTMKFKLLLTLFILLGSSSAQIDIVHVFPGQNGPNPPDAPQPSADMMGGVGHKYLVGFWNGGVSIRNKTDGKEVVPYRSQHEFWAEAFR